MTHTVLTIEDHGDTRGLIRMTLEYNGMAAMEANNGPLGLELARRHSPDLILLDVMMPGMNGLSVAEQLRADPQLHRIPVVMLSALAGQDNIDAGLRAGARAYLVKPFSPLALIDLIRDLVEGSHDSASALADAIRPEPESATTGEEPASVGAAGADGRLDDVGIPRHPAVVR